MLSEGVDIPRLRVGVFATTTTTELFFRQAVGRLVRHISRITGLSHSQVNAELNRRIGIERVVEATLAQLERRRDHAARWLAAA